jgi:hypothetical protein
MTGLLIQYSTSTAFASGIIRRLSHSQFSHVDLVLPGEGLMGVSGPDKYVVDGKPVNDPGGVLIRPFNPWPYLTPPKTARIETTAVIAAAVIAAGRSQLGKPFDNSALWDFLEDTAEGAPDAAKARDWRDQSSWFCSEWLAFSAETGGLFPYPLIAAKNRITPADSLLLLNPLMSPANIAEFLT